MPANIGRRRGEPRWDHLFVPDGDKENPLPRLRYEVRRVDHDRAKLVTGARQGRCDGAEVFTPIRRQNPKDVLKDNGSRRTPVRDECID